VSERTSANFRDVRKAIIDLLRGRSKKARFVTEICASLQRLDLQAQQVERMLAQLEAEGAVLIRDHFCADPHLAGVDLRIVGLVDKIEGEDAQMHAIGEIDRAWDKWLADYLANHRCG
jgi:hypothetical protein